MIITLFSDGGARGNPGPAGIGFVALVEDQLVYEHGEKIGETTNNVAEYTAVIRGLNWLQTYLTEHKEITSIEWKLDSKLVVEQLGKRWKIKEPHLRELALECWKHLSLFSIPCLFRHVPREQNSAADALVNSALDS
ncbi:MAG: ribonuclease H [Candidatus Pacebacteria bacterium CG_4_10_14_0_8_um_filter_42_14]|nr:MAG: ribonuclease H [Candidatus Pacebacteria bacterium CG_4_10_14_0_8_um_filter_42_14]